LTFDDVTIANRNRATKWHPGFPNPDPGGWNGADWSNAMCGEAGEAANVVKKLRRCECGLRGIGDPTEGELVSMLADEIADVFIYLDLLATYYGVDLPVAVVAKFNRVSERQGFSDRLPTSSADRSSGEVGAVGGIEPAERGAQPRSTLAERPAAPGREGV